jgi:organic radical activating enzyme
LRCRECSTYVPYAKKQSDEDIVLLEKSIDKLVGAYNKIGNIGIYGGEPLIYKELKRLLDYVLSFEQFETVTIITNGTIMPDDELILSMKSDKIRVRISDYRSLSVKKHDLINVFKHNHIRYEVTQHGQWNSTPTVDLINEDIEQLRRKIRNCVAICKLPVLISGKLFFCSVSGYYDFYKAVPDLPDGYIDLLDFKGTGDELRQKINEMFQMVTNGIPKQVCKYCKFDYLAQNLPVAEQMNGFLEFKKVY